MKKYLVMKFLRQYQDYTDKKKKYITPDFRGLYILKEKYD